MYQLTETESNIRRVGDNAYIPADPANSDYAAYLQWLNGWTETIRAPSEWTPEIPGILDDEGNELTALIPGYWTEGAVIETIEHPPHTPEPYVPPPVDMVAEITKAMDALFDATAQAKHYDNRITCALRAGYPGPFQAEGIAFASWMDSQNAKAYLMLAQVQAGTLPMPESVEAALALLDPMVWPS